jgi:hypothetical protein
LLQLCRAQRPKSVSLIGCIHCQQVCPDNKKFLQWIEGDEGFSHEETTLFLAGPSVDQLPAATVKKPERLELLGYLHIFLATWVSSSEQVISHPVAWSHGPMIV